METVLRTELPHRAVQVWVTEEVLGPEYVVMNSWYVNVFLTYSHGRLTHVRIGLEDDMSEMVEVPAGWQPTDEACMALAKSFVEKLKREGRA